MGGYDVPFPGIVLFAGALDVVELDGGLAKGILMLLTVYMTSTEWNPRSMVMDDMRMPRLRALHNSPRTVPAVPSSWRTT